MVKLKNYTTPKNISWGGDCVVCTMCDTNMLVDRCEENCPACGEKGCLSDIEDSNGSVLEYESEECEIISKD